MQTLWSRVAQTKCSCRCPQCLLHANGVTRRATGSATRRMPKYLTSSTLWYSGIFAAAATIDAGVKNKRREQWDRAIEEVKQDLGQQASSFGKEELLSAYGGALQATEEATTQFKPFESLSEGDEIFHDASSDGAAQSWPANTGIPLDRDRVAPLSVYANKERKTEAERKVWSPKKLATVQTSVELLQIRLFQLLLERGWTQEAADAVPKTYQKHVLQDSATLRRQHVAKSAKLKRIMDADDHLTDYQAPEEDHDANLCNYTQDDLSHFHSTARKLNSSLRQLFEARKGQKISQAELLAKISFNLSLSSAPPNLDTYNSLLTGLLPLQEPRLIRHIIVSMCETHMRMNEVSLHTIFRHYLKTHDVENFVDLIGKMRGKGGGLALAHPDIRVNERNRDRLLRKQDQPEKLIQLPYPTPVVFGAVVKGILQFAGFDAALSMCQGMGHEGWGLCMTGLSPLLQDCASRGDWASGMAVWKQIQELKLKSRIRRGSRWISEQIGLGTFASMLLLCTKCKQQDVFEDIWRQACISHKDSEERLARLVRTQSSGAAQVVYRLPMRTVDTDHTPLSMGASDVLPSSGNDTRASPIQNVVEPKTVLDRFEDVRQQSRDEAEMSKTPANQKNAAAEQQRAAPLACRTSHESAAVTDLPRKSDPVRMRPVVDRHSLSLQQSQLQEEHLFGLLPNLELDEYELRERPMTLHG